MTDYSDLRAKAEAATPGEWKLDYHENERAKGENGDIAVMAGEGESLCWPAEFCHSESDASYIAAAQPMTILALLDEREKLVRLLKAHRYWKALVDNGDRSKADGVMATRNVFVALEACSDIESEKP